MKKSMYYAIYDISNNNTRTATIHTLKDQGFVRIQKSVFCGRISNQQKKDLIEIIKQLIFENDSFYLVQSCNVCFGKIIIVGKGFDKKYVAGQWESMVI